MSRLCRESVMYSPTAREGFLYIKKKKQKKPRILHNVMQRVVTYLIFRESVGLKEIGTPSRLSPPYQQRIGKVGELGHQHADQGADHDEHGAEAQDDHGPVGDQGRVAAARSTGVAGKAAERRRRGVCCPGKPSVLPLPDEESPAPPPRSRLLHRLSSRLILTTFGMKVRQAGQITCSESQNWPSRAINKS